MQVTFLLLFECLRFESLAETFFSPRLLILFLLIFIRSAMTYLSFAMVGDDVS